MKTCVIIDETYFFHPKFINDLCKNKTCNITGVILVKKIPKKNSLSGYLVRNFLRLHISEMIILFLINFKKKIKDLLYIFLKIGFPQSVKTVLKFHKINFIEANYSLDKIEIINFIKKSKAKLILSSNPLFIPKKIIDLDNLIIVNRHSSYLPYNGGVWPAFYVISNKIDFTGVSIHLVNDKIDTGQIIFQKKFQVSSKNLYDIYEYCFKESVDIFIKSLDILKNNKIKLNKNLKNKIFYNSFPESEDWKKFRQNGGVFVKWKNLYKLF